MYFFEREVRSSGITASSFYHNFAQSKILQNVAKYRSINPIVVGLFDSPILVGGQKSPPPT